MQSPVLNSNAKILRKEIQSYSAQQLPQNNQAPGLMYDPPPLSPQTLMYSSQPSYNDSNRHLDTLLPPQSMYQRQAVSQLYLNGSSNLISMGPMVNHPVGEHKIVVGLDFGTTYSAIAWGDSINTNIELIDTWPTTGFRVHHSVPTELHYPEGNTSNYNWGYDIPPNVKRLKLFKLCLEGLEDGDEYKGIIDIPQSMKVTDVVTDFMKALYTHTMETLYRKKGRQLMEITKVDFMLTVPAVWSDAAKQRTQRCAEAAGLANGHKLSMTSEPEAAALYYIKSQDNLSIQTGMRLMSYKRDNCLIEWLKRIVVCDCGGGTVDLISYLVLEIEPTLRVREIAVGEGDFWGSTKIDKRFEELFKHRMGDHYLSLRPETQQKVVKNFEEIKCAFRDRPDQEFYQVSVPTVDTIPEAGVKYGEFAISRQEMRELFDPIVNAILGLLEKQIASGSRESPINSILLVGGFGESMYLYNRVSDWARPLDIMVLQPRGAATSIVKGAVLRGLEIGNDVPLSHKSCVERLARKNYGTQSNQEFVPGKHFEKDAWVDSTTGKKMAMNQVSWFVRKGQPLSDDTKVSNHFHRNFRKCTPWTDKILVSSADCPPSRIEGDVSLLCKMTSDLTKLSKKEFNSKWRHWRRYYEAHYTLNMSLESAQIKFELMYKDRSYGEVKAEFE